MKYDTLVSVSLVQPKVIISVGLVVALLLLVSLAQEMHRRWHVQREVAQLEAKVREAEKATIELQNLNRYFQTDAFQERLAREKLNFKAPGEEVILIPHNEGEAAHAAAPTEPTPITNSVVEQWWRLFFVSTAPTQS